MGAILTRGLALAILAYGALVVPALAQGLQARCATQLIELSSPGMSAADVCGRFDQGDFVTEQGVDGLTCYICPVEDYRAIAAPAVLPGALLLSDINLADIRSGNLEQGLRLDDCWEFPPDPPLDIVINGQRFAHGLGMHPLNSSAEGFAEFDVPIGATWFRAFVAFCDDTRPTGQDDCNNALRGVASANFAAYTDSNVAKLGPVTNDGQLLAVRVDGATTFTLTVDRAVDRGDFTNQCDWVIFADARFE